jgi:acyl-CoA synthetase (AMP-forming)/AMP-acid ligase II
MLDSLEEKIRHARTVSESTRPLPFEDIRKLIFQRKQDQSRYLVFYDDQGDRIEFSYETFYRLVLKTASFLQKKGFTQGDRISTISHNHWHTAIHYFASWLLGLVVIPVNLGEDDSRIEYILRVGNVKLAFVREQYKTKIQHILDSDSGLESVEPVYCDEGISAFTADENSLSLSEHILSESEALIVFTSGTTGPPKAVVLTQKNLLEDARAITDWHNIDSAARMMCVLPIHHVNGTVVTLLTPFFSGSSVVLNQKFSTQQFFPVAEKEDVDIVSVVPTLLQYLSHYYADRQKPECGSLRHIICGAGPLTVNVAETFEESFGIRIIHGYGLSETTCYSCFVPCGLDSEEHRKWRSEFRYPSIGIPLPVNEMAIHNADGKMLSEKERGEIVIRGENVMKGYFNNRDANLKAFKNGWFRSGDEGFYIKDKKGRNYFFITGRLKELIIRGGVNLSPLEIDEVINRAPGVKAGIAVGFENEWYGEEVGAFVTLKENRKPDSKAILDFCKEHLPFSKCPKVVVFGDEIPVTSTGKYQRVKVAHLFEEWKEKQFRE